MIEVSINPLILPIMKKLSSFLAICFISLSISQAGNCPGELNCDGVIDQLDLQIFLTELGSTNPVTGADLDCDGVVSGADLLTFLSLYGTTCCSGDMNYDGFVDDADLAILSTIPTDCLVRDFNCDGTYDLDDKQLVMDNYENPCPPMRIGAPTSLLQVFPNPTTDMCTIRHDLGAIEGLEMVVINYMGQEVGRYAETTKVSLAGQPDGTYFVQLRFQGITLTGQTLLKL